VEALEEGSHECLSGVRINHFPLAPILILTAVQTSEAEATSALRHGRGSDSSVCGARARRQLALLGRGSGSSTGKAVVVALVKDSTVAGDGHRRGSDVAVTTVTATFGDAV
jgi:hypothetical protein